MAWLGPHRDLRDPQRRRGRRARHPRGGAQPAARAASCSTSRRRSRHKPSRRPSRAISPSSHDSGARSRPPSPRWRTAHDHELRNAGPDSNRDRTPLPLVPPDERRRPSGRRRHRGSARGRRLRLVAPRPSATWPRSRRRSSSPASMAALTPTGAGCEDSLVTCAALAPLTSTLRFLVAFRPSLMLPTVLAQQAATFQRISGGRLALNVVTGGDPVEQRAFGDFSDHDERYRRTDEFLTILRGLFAGPHRRLRRRALPRRRRTAAVAVPTSRRRSTSAARRRWQRTWRRDMPTPT